MWIFKPERRRKRNNHKLNKGNHFYQNIKIKKKKIDEDYKMNNHLHDITKDKNNVFLSDLLENFKNKDDWNRDKSIIDKNHV